MFFYQLIFVHTKLQLFEIVFKRCKIIGTLFYRRLIVTTKNVIVFPDLKEVAAFKMNKYIFVQINEEEKEMTKNCVVTIKHRTQALLSKRIAFAHSIARECN